jgi:hypothetical protein
VSPRRAGAQADVTGSGPDGRITPDDIRAKAEELAGGVESHVQSARPLLMYAAVGGALLVTLAAFWLGRRSGRRRSTVVEIRRG